MKAKSSAPSSKNAAKKTVTKTAAKAKVAKPAARKKDVKKLTGRFAQDFAAIRSSMLRRAGMAPEAVVTRGHRRTRSTQRCYA